MITFRLNVKADKRLRIGFAEVKAPGIKRHRQGHPVRLLKLPLMQSDFEPFLCKLAALDTLKFNSPLEGKRFLRSEIKSDIERLDIERCSQTKSHGMIPLSQ